MQGNVYVALTHHIKNNNNPYQQHYYLIIKIYYNCVYSLVSLSAAWYANELIFIHINFLTIYLCDKYMFVRFFFVSIIL